MEVIKKLTLCSSASCCPDIEVVKDENGEFKVILEENGQKMELSKDAWNILVNYIKTGELTEL